MRNIHVSGCRLRPCGLLRLFALLGVLMIVAATPASAADRPNLLWITSEDNSPYLGCYGDPQAHTPRLDRLAAEGRALPPRLRQRARLLLGAHHV